MQKTNETERLSDLKEQRKGESTSVKNKAFASKVKRKILRHVWVVRITIILLFVLGLLAFIVLLGSEIKKTQIGFYYTLAKDFLLTPADKYVKTGNKINILVLGKGGKGHEGPDLTDTMMIVSVDLVNSKVRLLSLPRDIWVADLRSKLNSIYYWGNKKKEGGGLVLAKSVVEETTGLKVHYGVVIDFSGFKDIIDVLGGIQVNVANGFIDEKYPIAGLENDTCGGHDPEFKCRYETIHFNKGLQSMSGEIALKFVRSRNSRGDEGTDFARAARQQRVLEGIKNKMLTRGVLTSPKKLYALKDALLTNLETDVSPETGSVIARFIFNSRDNLKTIQFPTELLDRPPYSKEYDNLYVFIPKGGNWDEIHRWVADYITKD